MFRSLFFVTLAAGLSAQPLSLSESLRRAEAQNPALLAQGYAGRAAGALIDQAGARPNPTLSVGLENFAGTGALRGADSLETTVQASQTFERGGKREKRVAVATREREVAEQETAVRRAEVLAATAAAYIGVLAAQERLASSAGSRALAQELADAVTARVNAAAASPLDISRARVALVAARAEHTRAEAELAHARVALAATWGGIAEDVPSIAVGLSVPAEQPPHEALLAKLVGHPRIALQQALISGRRAELQLAQAQRAQDVTVGGGVRFLSDRSDAGFVAGVSVPIPFRNQNQGNIRAARETLAGAEKSVRTIEAELRTAFTVAWQDMHVAHTVARDLRAEALPAAEEALALTRQANAQGELPLLDVLAAQRALVSLRREILDADTACATARVRLDALTDPTFPLTTALFSSR